MKNQSISRRGFLQLVAVGSTVAFVAGCQPAAPGASSGSPSTEVTELHFIKLAMSEAVQAYFEDTAVPGFSEKNPQYTVTVDMSDWGHLGEKLLTSFAGNLPVDLVETGSDW